MRIADHMLDGAGRIDEQRWASARVTTEPIGRCHCGADVYAEATDGAFGRRFLTAVCARDHEAVIPATRVVRAPTAARVLVGVGGVSDARLAAGRARDAAILGEHD